MKRLALIAFCLAGCSATIVPSTNPLSVQRPAAALHGESGGRQFLYVANYGGEGSVTTYPLLRTQPLRTIRFQKPNALAFDAAEDLFVSTHGNGLRNSGNIAVYPPGSIRRKATIDVGISGPTALAIGYQRLFVANSSAKNHHVSEYSLPSLKYAGNVAVDPTLQTVAEDRGALYVALEKAIIVFDAKTGQKLRTIEHGVSCPNALAFDPAGDVFVANRGCRSSDDSVTVYRRGTGALLHTITDGISGPVALAFDALGTLYVANNAASNVAVYVHREIHPYRVITDGILNPTALVFNDFGELYVANSGTGAGDVTEYETGASSPVRTFTEGINDPVALAVGKQ